MIALMLLRLFVNCLYVVGKAKKYGRKIFRPYIVIRNL